MIATRDIAWLAGILEGEGSFMMDKTAHISVQMSDRDIIERVSKITGGKVRGPYTPKGGKKETWICGIYASRAIGWMLTLFTFMGERRREKISEVIAEWKSRPRHPRARRGERLRARCHPERLRVSQGLCKQCYMVEWRAKRAQGA